MRNSGDAHVSILITNGYAKPESLANKWFQKMHAKKVFVNEHFMYKSERYKAKEIIPFSNSLPGLQVLLL